MLKNKKGISLIVLIITIIIVIILASVVIISFSNSNPTEKAIEAKFKSDLQGFKEELLATHVNNLTEDNKYVKEDINVDLGNYPGMRLYIPDITEEYCKKLFIKRGELLYIDDEENENYSEEEEIWAREIGIQSPYRQLGDANGDGLINAEDNNFIQKIASNVIDKNSLTEKQKKACDVDKSGQINVADSIHLGKFIEGIISDLGYVD